MPGARELRNALIVGASSGIGLATVKRLSNDFNLRIYSASRTCSEELLRLSRFIRTDVTCNASVNNLCEEVLRDCNKLDILIHAAGNAVAGPIEETSIEEALAQFDTNFWGVVRVTSGLLPSMRRSGGGLIIVIGSMAGMIPLPFQAYYSASKFALEAYCESLAFEVAPYGVRVCLIQPGDIKTDFTANRTMARRFSQDSPYWERCSRCLAIMEQAEMDGQPADRVAETVARIIGMRKPPMRKRVSKPFEEFILCLRRFTFPSLYNFVVRKGFKE